MPLLKIVIADDEKEARELLLHYLHQWQNIGQVTECGNGESTLHALKDVQPHILFLDIKMPELTGIEVLQKKEPSLFPGVIFTTAFDEYALPAFDYEAVDYLLKPFEKDRFDKAMRKAIDYVDFVTNKKTRDYLVQLPVKTGSRTDLVPVKEVDFFQAEGAYVQAVTETKTYLLTDPIYELESLLHPAHFARVHRSIIVNIHKIKSIQSLLNGDHVLTLNNGRELRASRTYREKIKKLLQR